MPKRLVKLEVSEQQVNNGDISLLVGVFTTMKPKDAKLARGSFFLTFPQYDKDPREVWVIPEARLFMGALRDAIPYFPYFLVPDPRAAQIMFWLSCLADLGGTDDAQVDVFGAMAEFTTAAVAIKQFCGGILDDYQTVMQQISSGLPDEMRVLMTSVIDKLH